MSPGRRALLPLLLLAPAAPARAADYFVGAETRLTADRWRGTRPEPVERFDVRPRLRLGAFDLEGDGAETDRFRFVADLEVGADFGRTEAEREAARQVLGDTRRTELDLYFAYFDANWVTGRDFSLSTTVGRHLLVDAVGLDAVDGATVRVRVPYVTFEGTGGLPVRRGWSSLGPDIHTPDGLPLGDMDDPAWLTGAALESAFADLVVLRGAWRRQFEDSEHVQREEAGGAVEVTPLRGLALQGTSRYDLIYKRLASVGAGAGWTFADPWRTEVAWQREHPTFGADSIWNAFSAEPYDDFTTRLRWEPELWRLAADGGMRQFYSGETEARQASIPEDRRDAAPAVDAVSRAWDAGLRGERLLGDPTARDTAVGAEGRLGAGYGGTRIYGDLFGRMPVALSPGVAPLQLSGRLGAVHFDDEQQAELSGVSGWAVVTTAWQAAESVRLELLGEGHASRFTPFRGRLFAQVTLEEWL